jgi:hypothetical protein
MLIDFIRKNKTNARKMNNVYMIFKIKTYKLEE